MMWQKPAILALSMCLASAAVADSKFYFGAAWSDGDLDNYSIKPNGLDFKIGREFGKWLAIEVHGNVSALKNDNIIRDPDIYAGAVFARLNLPLDRVNIFVMGGASRVEYDNGVTSVNDTDSAYGFGLDLVGTPDNMFTIEAVVYNYDRDDDLTRTTPSLEYKVLNIGYTHRFGGPSLR